MIVCARKLRKTLRCVSKAGDVRCRSWRRTNMRIAHEVHIKRREKLERRGRVKVGERESARHSRQAARKQRPRQPWKHGRISSCATARPALPIRWRRARVRTRPTSASSDSSSRSQRKRCNAWLFRRFLAVVDPAARVWVQCPPLSLRPHRSTWARTSAGTSRRPDKHADLLTPQ